MAITYPRVQQEVLNILGAVLGSTPSLADTNYNATPSTSTVIGPDFLASQALDAIVWTQGEIVEAIASVPLHPERVNYADVTAALPNRGAIPHVGQTGATIIGAPGVVRDSVNGFALLAADLDKIRGFNQFSATVYNNFTPYWYAINANRIEHTRTNVVIEVCVYQRPSILTGNIALDDWHEGGLVMGAVAKLALKESLFDDLYKGANEQYQMHLATVRNYKDPALYAAAQAAPALA